MEKAGGKHRANITHHPSFLQAITVLGSELDRLDKRDRLDIGALPPSKVLLHTDTSPVASYRALKSDPYSVPSLGDMHSKLSFSFLLQGSQ